MERLDQYASYCHFLKQERTGKKPKVLVHACCCPCSTEVIEVLKKAFDITIFYYNPNIYPLEEYEKRKAEFLKIPQEFSFLEGTYNPKIYDEQIQGLEESKEGGKRCYACYSFRLEETAKKAKELGFDYFTTTLSISPYKNSDWINELGQKFAEEYDVLFLYSNFKKQDGYKKSIALSKQYQLYRQEYCGCKYSLEERKLYIENKTNPVS